jgi:hypothetical protein
MSAIRRSTLPICCALLLGLVAVARPADAAVSETVLALAGPLAEQFGVPSSAVTGLLGQGVSLESVTQLLLVAQDSGKGLDAVTSLFRESGDDIGKTAEQLDVADSTYSDDAVSAAIGRAQQKLQADATDSAKDEATKALGSALGGLAR